MNPEVLMFVFSLLIEVGIVMYNRSITKGRVLVGVMLTMGLALLGFYSTIFIVDNHDLMTPAIFGHGLGFVLGMLIPLGESETHGPKGQ